MLFVIRLCTFSLCVSVCVWINFFCQFVCFSAFCLSIRAKCVKFIWFRISCQPPHDSISLSLALQQFWTLWCHHWQSFSTLNTYTYATVKKAAEIKWNTAVAFASKSAILFFAKTLSTTNSINLISAHKIPTFIAVGAMNEFICNMVICILWIFHALLLIYLNALLIPLTFRFSAAQTAFYHFHIKFFFVIEITWMLIAIPKNTFLCMLFCCVEFILQVFKLKWNRNWILRFESNCMHFESKGSHFKDAEWFCRETASHHLNLNWYEQISIKDRKSNFWPE